ncbi:MAG TPA: hypothetical protein VGM89_01145 [Puia sp.]|jgi:hypothetical protein
MRTKKIIAVLMLLSVWTPGRLLAQSDVKEQLVVPLSDPGKPVKIVAHVLNSTLRVIGYEGKEVTINVTAEAGHRRENAGGMKRIGGGAGGEVTADENHNTVNISSGLSHFSVIEIRVPATSVSLDIGTVNEGKIEVENVTGQLEVSNVNGPITCTNVGGSVVANTVNGSVVVTLKSIDPQAPMAFSTLNGNIDVTFPAAIKANVKLKAEHNDIFSDFDVEITKTNPTVKKSTEGHMSKITIDDWVYGKISGGGPEIMMNTTFGSIYIRKAK